MFTYLFLKVGLKYLELVYRARHIMEMSASVYRLHHPERVWSRLRSLVGSDQDGRSLHADSFIVWSTCEIKKELWFFYFNCNLTVSCSIQLSPVRSKCRKVPFMCFAGRAAHRVSSDRPFSTACAWVCASGTATYRHDLPPTPTPLHDMCSLSSCISCRNVLKDSLLVSDTCRRHQTGTCVQLNLLSCSKSRGLLTLLQYFLWRIVNSFQLSLWINVCMYTGGSKVSWIPRWKVDILCRMFS